MEETQEDPWNRARHAEEGPRKGKRRGAAAPSPSPHLEVFTDLEASPNTSLRGVFLVVPLPRVIRSLAMGDLLNLQPLSLPGGGVGGWG